MYESVYEVSRHKARRRAGSDITSNRVGIYIYMNTSVSLKSNFLVIFYIYGPLVKSFFAVVKNHFQMAFSAR